MTPSEFCRRIAALGYSQRGFAAYVGANERTVRRWALGEQDIPRWVSVVLTLLERLEGLDQIGPAMTNEELVKLVRDEPSKTP